MNMSYDSYSRSITKSKGDGYYSNLLDKCDSYFDHEYDNKIMSIISSVCPFSETLAANVSTVGPIDFCSTMFLERTAFLKRYADIATTKKDKIGFGIIYDHWVFCLLSTREALTRPALNHLFDYKFFDLANLPEYVRGLHESPTMLVNIFSRVDVTRHVARDDYCRHCLLYDWYYKSVSVSAGSNCEGENDSTSKGDNSENKGSHIHCDNNGTFAYDSTVSHKHKCVDPVFQIFCIIGMDLSHLLTMIKSDITQSLDKNNIRISELRDIVSLSDYSDTKHNKNTNSSTRMKRNVVNMFATFVIRNQYQHLFFLFMLKQMYSLLHYLIASNAYTKYFDKEFREQVILTLLMTYIFKKKNESMKFVDRMNLVYSPTTKSFVTLVKRVIELVKDNHLCKFDVLKVFKILIIKFKFDPSRHVLDQSLLIEVAGNCPELLYVLSVPVVSLTSTIVLSSEEPVSSKLLPTCFAKGALALPLQYVPTKSITRSGHFYNILTSVYLQEDDKFLEFAQIRSLALSGKICKRLIQCMELVKNPDHARFANMLFSMIPLTAVQAAPTKTVFPTFYGKGALALSSGQAQLVDRIPTANTRTRSSKKVERYDLHQIVSPLNVTYQKLSVLEYKRFYCKRIEKMMNHKLPLIIDWMLQYVDPDESKICDSCQNEHSLLTASPTLVASKNRLISIPCGCPAPKSRCFVCTLLIIVDELSFVNKDYKCYDCDKMICKAIRLSLVEDTRSDISIDSIMSAICE